MQLLIGVRMSYKTDCINIEMEAKVTDKITMRGHEPIVNKEWYCYAKEINDYIDDCPEDCPYYVQKK